MADVVELDKYRGTLKTVDYVCKKCHFSSSFVLEMGQKTEEMQCYSCGSDSLATKVTYVGLTKEDFHNAKD